MLQYTVAVGCMRIISEMAKQGMLETVGLTPADWDKITAPEVWLMQDRNRVTAGLMSLLHSTLDQSGLNRFELSAEYIAAGVVVFVHPVNSLVACRYLEFNSPSEAMGRKAQEDVTAEQLHALFEQLYSDPQRSAARERFELKAKVQFRRSREKMEVNTDAKSKKSIET